MEIEMLCIFQSIHSRLKTNSIPIMHAVLKEYIKEEMRKGTYKEIQYQPITFIPYGDSAFDDLMIMEDEDSIVCCSKIVNITTLFLPFGILFDLIPK